MGQRKGLSKKLRFEVFKRDKFTCQYCGKEAPNVILHVDHIEPVAKGGTNDILNLITSCQACNSGKSDRRLDDTAVLDKQNEQLDTLQDRREQIELMFEWRKGLDKLDSDTTQMVIDYIEGKIDDFTLNESGSKKIAGLTKKFQLPDILEAFDISAERYLHYDDEGNLYKDAVETFINKIGGILTIKDKPPIDQKLAYIKGICRNRFSHWNKQTGSIILNQYVTALREYGWSEDKILNDLENELIPKTKECNNWSSWKNLLESWTDSVRNWDHPEDEEDFFLDYPELILPEGDVYVDEYVLHAIGIRYFDETGIVIKFQVDRIIEECQNPKLLSEIADRNPEYYQSCVLNAFDGKVLKAGKDYILDIPLQSSLLRAIIDPNMTINDFFIALTQDREEGYSADDDLLSEAFFLSLSPGPIPLPFVY